MLYKTRFLMALLVLSIAACVDDDTVQANPFDPNESTITQKPAKKQAPPDDNPQFFDIDYGSNYSKVRLPTPVAEKTNNFTEPHLREVFYNGSKPRSKWESNLHNKPLSEIRFKYLTGDNNKKPALLNIVTYSKSELDILDLAFPDALTVEKIILKDDLSGFLVDTSNTISSKNNQDVIDQFSFMNIICTKPVPKLSDSDKHVDLKDILSLSSIFDEGTAKIKIRYRYILQSKTPLAIVSIVLGDMEISVNRSAIYSGACIVDSQYNQDQILNNIQNLAKEDKKGIWGDSKQ